MKKKVQKRSNKKNLIVILLGTIILGVIIISIILNSINIDRRKETKEVVGINEIEEQDKKVQSKSSEIEDWNLIVVNKENYLTKNYAVDLVKIEYGYEIDKRIEKNLNNMLKDIRKEGLEPWICSAYRSSETQNRLYNKKVEYYKEQGYIEKKAKEKASYWVAIPGTSEHEIGLSLDIVSKNYQLLDKNQENTPEQKWLMEHCYEYGFVMRYPTQKKEITKIDYEPWHYRYVGVENAKVMKENNFCLEEYIEYLKKDNS